MEQSSWSTAKVGPLIMPVSESMQASNSPPSTKVVMKEVGFSKGDKAAGTAELSPFFFNSSGEVLASELKNWWD